MKKLRPLLINIVSVLILFSVFSLMSGDSFYRGLFISIGINVILAVSLNLTVGFLGELALGHAGFMSVGAYASALFVINANLTWLPPEMRLIAGLIFGGLVAAIFGLIIGIPALKLKGDYLAIITLGFGEIIRVIIQNLKFTGGARGLTNIPELTNVYNIFWITTAVIVIMYLIIRSRHGRAITAIREDMIAAESSGIPAFYYKILTFTVSAFFAGVAGGLYAHYCNTLGAENFGFMKSIEILVIVVLGGMGSITGSIIAAFVLTLLPEALRQFDLYRMLVYSILLIVMMIFKPSGLFGRYEFSITRAINKVRRVAANNTRK